MKSILTFKLGMKAPAVPVVKLPHPRRLENSRILLFGLRVGAPSNVITNVPLKFEPPSPVITFQLALTNPHRLFLLDVLGLSREANYASPDFADLLLVTCGHHLHLYFN